MQAAGPLLSLSPSFNSYSCSGAGNLAEIAARVVNELRNEGAGAAVYFSDDEPCWPERPGDDHDDDGDPRRSSVPRGERSELRDDHDDEEESEFEFAFVCREPESSPISADEIFYNGQIRPVYPLFDRNLLLDHHPQNDVVQGSNDGVKNNNNNTAAAAAKTTTKETTRRRQPLRKLMVEEERETTTSCSSSEADELDGLQQGTFCVWKPKNGAVSGNNKKSGSTGSSKRWKFRDLLSRSNSDGKDRFVFLAPSTHSNNNKKVAAAKGGNLKGGNQTTPKFKAGATGNDVVFSANDKTTRININKDDNQIDIREGRKSFFPYKQDLVGFLANVNGLSKNLHPF